MSAYSSVNVTRTAAKTALVTHILSKASDQELTDMLDALLRGRLYRVSIVGDGDEDHSDDVLQRLGD